MIELLKPCPFCGGNLLLQHDGAAPGEHVGGQRTNGPVRISFWCTWCHVDIAPQERSQLKAMQAVNRRPPERREMSPVWQRIFKADDGATVITSLEDSLEGCSGGQYLETGKRYKITIEAIEEIKETK